MGPKQTLLLYLIAVGGSELCSKPGIKLRGSATICPGNSGIFECKTTDTGSLVWRVNNSDDIVTTLLLSGSHTINDSRIERPGYIAHLVTINLSDRNIGNRTSILVVLPSTSNNTITVACTGGNEEITCRRDISFIGTGTVEKPVYHNYTRSADGEFVTLFWEHDSRATVSHYILTLVAAKDGGQVLQYNVAGTSITVPSTSIDLNGMLSAVSVCGDKSELASFQVTASGTTGLKSVPALMILCLTILGGINSV